MPEDRIVLTSGQLRMIVFVTSVEYAKALDTSSTQEAEIVRTAALSKALEVIDPRYVEYLHRGAT